MGPSDASDRPAAPPPPLPPPPPPAPLTAPAAPQGQPITIPTARTALRGCVPPLLAYGVALLAALVVAIVLIAAIALTDGGSSSDDPSSTIDIEAIATLIGIPVQLAAMALGGSVSLGDSEFQMGLYAPPLVITAVFAAAAFVLSRRAERAKPSPSTAERLIVAAAGATVTAVAALIVTFALAMRDDGTAMHAADVGLFFGTWLLAGSASYAGRRSAHGSLWPRWFGTTWRRGAHLVTQHVLAWLVVIPLAAGWLWVSGDLEAALYGLVWAPTMALDAFAMGHLGALSVAGEQGMAWELGWFPGIVLPLLGIALTVVAAIGWHLRRTSTNGAPEPTPLTYPANWLVLPVSYAVGALVVCLLSTMRLTTVLFGHDDSASAHGAYWLIPVLAVWGLAVEALSLFVAPRLAGALPPTLTRRLAHGPVAPAPAATPAPGSAGPMSPADRVRAKKALIGVGAVAGAALVLGIIYSVLSSQLADPKDRAEEYLDALVDGDVEAVTTLSEIDGDEASEVFLTDAVYAAAGDRITGYEITDVEESGDSATVTVDLEGPEGGSDVELTLTADGHRALLFKDWKVDDGGLAREVTVSIPDSSATLAANGVATDVPGGEDTDFWLLPGSYVFDPYGASEWLEPATTPTSVPAEDTWGIYAEVGDPAPSDALKEYVDSAVSDLLEECMAATELDPANCPQEAYAYSDDQRKVVWTLDSSPTVDWSAFYGSFPADLSTTGGSATVTYESDESYGFGRPDWQKETEQVDLYLYLIVNLVAGEPKVGFDR